MFEVAEDNRPAMRKESAIRLLVREWNAINAEDENAKRDVIRCDRSLADMTARRKELYKYKGTVSQGYESGQVADKPEERKESKWQEKDDERTRDWWGIQRQDKHVYIFYEQIEYERIIVVDRREMEQKHGDKNKAAIRPSASGHKSNRARDRTATCNCRRFIV